MEYLVHHLLDSSAARFPDKEAVVHGDLRLTYFELQKRVSRYASTLIKAGRISNDRIGILLPPGIPQVSAIFSISAIGSVFVPIHHSLFKHQVSHIVTDCGIKSIITCGDLIDRIDPELKNSGLENVIRVDSPFETESSESLTCFAVESNDEANSIANTAAVENDLAAILYTSGSTGLPKGVMLSHKNVVAGASIVSDYLGITEQERILAALPFSFDAGLNQLTTAIQQGATIVLLNFMFAREIVAALNKENITGLAGVPPLWNLLVQDNSTLKKRPPASLRYITNTGGAMVPELLERLQDALPKQTEIVLMYGLTEAFRSTYLPPDQLASRPTSMGKAIPNTRIMVVREDGSLCGPRETGELVHHGPTVALGYWGNQKATDRVYRPHPDPIPGSGIAEKVVYSGDLVYFDEDEYLYFVGRKDSLIKSSGFRISPTEVEAGIMQAKQVAQAAVVGIQDDVLGQKLVGFVIPIDSAEFDEDELKIHLSEFLPRHMLPKSIHSIDTFPKTTSGKIDYPKLKQLAVELDGSE